MALVVADRVRETSTTTGTGTLTLSGAPLGYQTFSTAIGNGNTTYYTISNPGVNEWEVGIGTVGAGTLARTTLISSSTGSFVSFTGGSKDVFCTYPAERSVFTDNAATLTNKTMSGASNTFSNIAPTSLTTSTITIGSSSVSLGNTLASISGLTDLAATGQVNFTSTGAMLIPKGATGDRPAGTAGYLRFNTTTSEFEGYNGSGWASVGGAAISNDTSTSSNVYPLFASATSGTAATVYTSNAKLLYKPSTGEFQSSEIVATNGMLVHANTVTVSYSIPSNYNAIAAGPVTVDTGVTVTVPSGSTWVIA